MLRDSSGCASFRGSSNPSTAAVVSAGACLTSNPSYQAAVPSSPGHGVATLGACSASNPCYQAAVPSSVGYSTSSSKVYSSYKPSSQSTDSYSSSYHGSSSYPTSSQFPDPKLLPKSMMNISISDQVVNFYPVHKKGPNYLKYCIGWLSNEDKPRSMRDCIWQYTSGPNWYCTEVNMALASDSPKLKSYGSYIKQLKYSIGMSQMKFSGIVFRG
ncbi:unnamed protein product [Rotaria sordida]|uniref:Uncharacterized protein n=1 Tax=Rotaria sordida TaxID=392033 RepID=A0A814TX90_9BILA|nr:unnamed protein product [Rotaria sordida]CAF3828137.1 unnamed protein product [Rotaria sordida]